MITGLRGGEWEIFVGREWGRYYGDRVRMGKIHGNGLGMGNICGDGGSLFDHVTQCLMRSTTCYV